MLDIQQTKHLKMRMIWLKCDSFEAYSNSPNFERISHRLETRISIIEHVLSQFCHSRKKTKQTFELILSMKFIYTQYFPVGHPPLSFKVTDQERHKLEEISPFTYAT